jgi:hypothetical protein
MEQWGVEKKWLMINQDHQAELLASGVKQNKLQRVAAERTSIDISRLPPSGSASSPLKRQFSVKNLMDPKPIKSISSPVNTTPPPTHFTTDTMNISNNTLYNINTNFSTSDTSTSSPKLNRSPTIDKPTSTLSPTQVNSAASSNNHHFFDAYAVDRHSPEYFIRKFLDPNLRSVTPKIAASLEVCLRTRSIE